MARRTHSAVDYDLRYARNTRVGDEIVFDMASANYVVEEVDTDSIGQIRHRFNNDSASACYHPGQLLRVRRKT